MARLPWYKAEPRAFFDATRGWPNELKANYRLIIDLIYAHDGALPDDERWVAGELGCDVRVWRRLRTALIERGKLYLADGAIRNPRADKEVAYALAKLQLTVSAGLASAKKRRKSEAKSNDFNGSGGTDVPTDVPTIKNKSKSKKEKVHSEPSKKVPLPAIPPSAAAVAADGASSLKAAIWRTGVTLLGESARPLMGRWVRDYGLGAVAQALADCEREQPADARGWITAALQTQAGTRGSDRSPMASYRRVQAVLANAESQLTPTQLRVRALVEQYPDPEGWVQ